MECARKRGRRVERMKERNYKKESTKNSDACLIILISKL